MGPLATESDGTLVKGGRANAGGAGAGVYGLADVDGVGGETERSGALSSLAQCEATDSPSSSKSWSRMNGGPLSASGACISCPSAMAPCCRQRYSCESCRASSSQSPRESGKGESVSQTSSQGASVIVHTRAGCPPSREHSRTGSLQLHSGQASHARGVRRRVRTRRAAAGRFRGSVGQRTVLSGEPRAQSSREPRAHAARSSRRADQAERRSAERGRRPERRRWRSGPKTRLPKRRDGYRSS